MLATTRTTTDPAAFRHLCAALFWLAAGMAHGEASLRIDVGEIRESVGNLRFALYRDPASFRRETQALQVSVQPAQAGRQQALFTGLAAGSYAVVAYHDINGDAQLNLRFGMFPSEPYGLSNNPQVVGPPRFADSAIELGDGERQIGITLRD